jgi:ADP-ribosylation factor-binding protein GGA
LKDTFLQINDQINTVITRYEAFKKGDYTAARNPIPQEFAGSSSGGGGISLIDLDDGETAARPAAASTTANDLSDLFSSTLAQKPVIPHQPVLGIGTSIYIQPQPSGLQQSQPFAPIPILANGGFTGPSVPSLQQRPSHTATPPASIMLPATPGSTPAPATQVPNYFGRVGPSLGSQSFGGSNFGTGSQTQPGLFGSAPPQPQQPIGISVGYSSQQPSFGFGAPLQPQTQPQVQAQPAVGVTTTQQKKDPFADLAGLF